MANNAQQESDKEKKRFTDVQTDKRNHEHLTNEHDQISEEDINNIKTDDSILAGTPKTARDAGQNKSDDEKAGSTKEKEIIKDNEDPEIDTTWNILEP